MQNFGATPVTPQIQALTMKFLDPGRNLPAQAEPIAQKRAFGQQGAAQRRPAPGITPLQPAMPQPLSDRYFSLPEPIAFMQTPQGQAILQRILSQFSRGGLR